MLRLGTLLLGMGCVAAAGAQYAIGIQGGPLFSQGAWEATDALTDLHGWTTGVQFVEGRRGERGFRVGVDAGQRGYTIQAKSDESGINEEFSARSTMVWLSFEMRWPLSERHRIYFDLGPVIGFELHEQRCGVRYFEGRDFLGQNWSTEHVQATEDESGFAIRDGRWRMGFTAELPVADRLFATGGLHLCPGVGSWALGHGYATVDASARIGILYALSSRSKRGPGR